MLPDNIESFANALADQARDIALRYFRTKLDIHSKSDDTPVSIADQEIEQTLRTMIADRFPAHGILGEEFGGKHTESDYLWVIDPIDGTKSFICGHPNFGTLIALLRRVQPVLGVIEMPALKERWIGIKGKQSVFNTNPIKCKTTTRLRESVFCTTAPDFFTKTEFDIYDRLSQQGTFRLYGGDCYNYALLASGHVDIVMEAGLKPFDFMGLIPVIENAGGIVTDWSGNPMTVDSPGQILATANRQLHQRCLVEINKLKGRCP